MPGEFKLAGKKGNQQHSRPQGLDLRITAVDCVTDIDFVLGLKSLEQLKATTSLASKNIANNPEGAWAFT